MRSSTEQSGGTSPSVTRKKEEEMRLRDCGSSHAGESSLGAGNSDLPPDIQTERRYEMSSGKGLGFGSMDKGETIGAALFVIAMAMMMWFF